MMAAKQQSHRARNAGGKHTADGRSKGRGDDLQHISATDRWLMISKRVYGKAQRRGFVGGDPFADLSEAIREVDEEYVTDIPGILALTDPSEMMSQLRNLFAGYGLNKQSLDGVLERNREAIDRLARLNRSSTQPETQQAAQRKSLLKNTTNQAIKALQNLTRQVEDRTRSIPVLGETTQAAQAILSNLRNLAGTAGDIVRPAGTAGTSRGRRRRRELEMHGMVIKAYDGLSPTELADAPIAALKGVSEASGRKLKSAFGMHSIRDMATSRIFDQADGVVTLADAEQQGDGTAEGTSLQATALQALADGPVSRLQGVTPHQAKVLQHTLRVDSIRDLSTNRFFRLARAIVSVADAEQQQNRQS